LAQKQKQKHNICPQRSVLIIFNFRENPSCQKALKLLFTLRTSKLNENGINPKQAGRQTLTKTDNQIGTVVGKQKMRKTGR
jgi:hypothetical protein